MTPVICMITDRRRAGGEEQLVRRIASAARAGVHLVQIRERDLDGGPLIHLARRCIEAVRSTRTRVIVNDRLDVALAAGAHGVHLRGDSMPAPRVRALTPAGFIVGRSVHARHEAIQTSAAGGVDYLIFGSVFPTASKPGQPAAGVHALADVVAATSLPVLAVGGVAAETMIRLRDVGAAGFAAIGLFADVAEAGLEDAIRNASRAFDTPAAVP